MKQTKESQLVTRNATSKIIGMRASNIHLFLATHKQSTQHFAGKFSASRPTFHFFPFVCRRGDSEGCRMKDNNSLCVLVGHAHHYSRPKFPLQK